MRNQAIRKRRLLLFVTLAVVLAVNLAAVFPVSYTHLTLPTTERV